MRDGVAVAQVTLDHLAQVRSLVPQPFLALSSSGLGHHPLKVETRVRVPLGLPELEVGNRKLDVRLNKSPLELYVSVGFFFLMTKDQPPTTNHQLPTTITGSSPI